MKSRLDARSLVAGMLTAVLACGACDGSEQIARGFEDAPKDERDELDASAGGFTLTACSDGSTRSCSVILGEHNGVLSCFYGSQICFGGSWSPCGNGETIEIHESALRKDGGLDAQLAAALADAGAGAR
jgi:hypothetical protein